MWNSNLGSPKGSPKKLNNYYIKYKTVFNTIKASKMQTDNTKMQTDIKESDNKESDIKVSDIKENNGIIIAVTLANVDLVEDASDSDSDFNEQTLLNDSFRLTYGSDNEDNKDANYTCIMCGLVLKVRTSFCNAFCEQKYLKNED